MLVTTPAVVLSAVRYSESSKIVKLATRTRGLVSAIAKGALRPRSRFGAALQLLSEGTAQLAVRDHRDLQTLTAFDATAVHTGLAQAVGRYAAASALAEVMLRFAPLEPHPELYDLFSASLGALSEASPEEVEPLGLRLLWLLVSALGFAPSVDACARDGRPIDPDSDLAFSAGEGGALCPDCAAGAPVARLPLAARADLLALLDDRLPLPTLNPPNAAAHRRLLARYVRYHLAEGTELPGLAFWARLDRGAA